VNKNMPNTRRSDCPLSCFLDQWGDKWTFIILRDLLAGPKKFNDFLQSAEPLPTNLLANRLARLVEDGYVVKTQYHERPKRFEYTVTDKGLTLVPVMQTMVGWAVEHLDDLGSAPEELSAFRETSAEKKTPKSKPAAKKKPKVVEDAPAPASQGAFDF
jgi:DNA-binding HxlR family transcriptional regulator